jgi:hypothetical protein
MSQLLCRVFRGLPKEVEEEITKFLETTSCQVRFVTQSESGNHLSVTILYELDESVG